MSFQCLAFADLVVFISLLQVFWLQVKCHPGQYDGHPGCWKWSQPPLFSMWFWRICWSWPAAWRAQASGCHHIHNTQFLSKAFDYSESLTHLWYSNTFVCDCNTYRSKNTCEPAIFMISLGGLSWTGRIHEEVGLNLGWPLDLWSHCTMRKKAFIFQLGLPAKASL